MKKVITLISFLLTIHCTFSQSISPRLWVNNTYYFLDSIHYFSNSNELIDSMVFEVSETDSVTFELHHTNFYHLIYFYGSITHSSLFNPASQGFCTQGIDVGQVQIQGTKIDYMPYLIKDDTFFCGEDEIYFFYYNEFMYLDEYYMQRLHYIKLIRPQTLSTNEFSLPKIKLFPNPTSDWLTIEYEAPTLSTAITIYDISGGEVKKVNTNIENKQHTIDVSDLSPGVYFAEIKNDADKSVFEKFIVLK
jgi:hypothetical protein